MARRPVPLRIKVAVAGLAGVGLAWLIPKGGEVPEPMPTPTATDLPGVTAVEIPLDVIPKGISFHPAGSVRVFLARSGDAVVAFHGDSTAVGDGAVWWCPRNASFEDEGGEVRYDRDGRALLGTAPRDLDRVRLLVAADRVTIFPNDITPGAAAAPASGAVDRLPAPCSAAERQG